MGNKRPNGQGTVYQRRSDKKWVAAITVGKRPNGKPRQVVRYAKSKTEANKLLRELQKSAHLGEITSGGSTRVSDYLWQWLEGKKLEVRPQTAEVMRTRLAHIVAEIGELRLDVLTPAHIRRVYQNVLTTLAPRTVAVIHLHLREAFREAVEENFIVKSPMRGVSPPRWEESERQLLDPLQLGVLLSHLETHRLYALYALLAFTGIRSGEALGLKWSDIGWEDHVVTVQRNLSRVPGGYSLGPLKTRKSRRRIKIVPTLLDALRQHQDKQAFEKDALKKEGHDWQEPELIFTGLKGQPLNRSVPRRELLEALEVVGLPPMRVHDLRHSFATIASSGNVQPQNLQGILGHSNIGTTYNIYAAALERIMDEAVEAVEATVNRTKQRR